MIYFENASRGEEGFNTHLMSYTICVSLSNFLDRDFYFDYEIPCSTPPAYAAKDGYREKFGILLRSRRSLVSDLIRIPARRRFEIDREVVNKACFELLYSHFLTTEALRARFKGTFIWDSFGVGRIDLTREELQEYELIEWTHSKLTHPCVFYFLDKKEKKELLRTVEIRYLDEIESLAASIMREIGNYQAVHLRLGDFLTNYRADEYAVNEKRFRRYIETVFADRSLPVLVATDGLDEKKIFAELLQNYRTIFIDELIFDEYRTEYGRLPFTDFNVLSILNQILCAGAELFIGTYRSTFTSIIHRLRQERFSRRDFNFFPDDKVSKLLTADYLLAPDRQGFFDWNRYSVFAAEHQAIAWMREWDHQYTWLNLDQEFEPGSSS